MGNPVTKFTPVGTSVKVISDKLDMNGQVGYLVEPPVEGAETAGVKMDADGDLYEFKLSDIETLA